MTDDSKGAVGPQGPPWSVDVLADLHAGVLDPAQAERLWAQVRTDPSARAVLDALDSVKSDLGHLSTAPFEPMPAQFAARLDAAIQAETLARGRVATATQPAPDPARPAAPVVDLAAARKRRNRIAGWGVGVLTAAAAAAVIAVVAIPHSTTGGTAEPQQSRSTEVPGQTGNGSAPPVALAENDLGSAVKLLGKFDYGKLGDEQGLRDCLESKHITMADPLGAGQVIYEGQDAVAAIVGAGTKPGRYRVIVVEPTCAKVFANTQIG